MPALLSLVRAPSHNSEANAYNQAAAEMRIGHVRVEK